MAANDRTSGLVGNAAIKVPCAATTTAAITLSAEQTIDGVAVVANDRILVKDQADSIDNGVYIVSTGTWARAEDCDGNRDLVNGTLVYVFSGTSNSGWWYCSSSDEIVVGTDTNDWALAGTPLAQVSAFMQTMLNDADAVTGRQTLLLDTSGADVASGATIDLDSTTGDFVDVTGTATITAITLGDGVEKVVRFTGVLTLTHGASLVLPDSANIETASGDVAIFRGDASSVVRCINYLQLQAQSPDVASAGTIDLDAASGDLVDVTGTTTITAITLAQGRERTVRFTGALTLTHGASLVLPGSANITTAAGDFAIFRGYASDVVRCVNYQVIADSPGMGIGVQQIVTVQDGAVATGTTLMVQDDTIPQNTEGDEYMTLAITPLDSANLLFIEAIGHWAITNAGGGAERIMALFQDSTADALAVAAESDAPAANQVGQVVLRHSMTAGTTSATTFKIRFGTPFAGTNTFNGTSASREFGGVFASGITITEYAT